MTSLVISTVTWVGQRSAWRAGPDQSAKKLFASRGVIRSTASALSLGSASVITGGRALCVISV